jgi:hypothetical protein
MASVLLPKYNLGQISTNFFNRTQAIPLSQFIANNFLSTANVITGTARTNGIQQANLILINQMAIDYGNGPISDGMQSLTLINTNVVTGMQLSSDVFNNTILYGATIPFNTVTNNQGRLIVLTNLQITQILNLVSSTLQQNFYILVDAIVSDLRKGTYLSSNYSTSLLRQARVIAQSAAGIIHGINS